MASSIEEVNETVELRQINENDKEYENDIRFLYELLQQRDSTINISHKTIPSFYDHSNFWKSKPYKFASMIEYNGTKVGYTYVSHANEIGIFIDKQYQGKEIGTKTIQILIQKFKGEPLFANINPLNLKSRALFIKLRFKHIQNTYRIN